jgi:hypothetical protein
MMITICDHCRKEINGNPDAKDCVKPASIPLPLLDYQKEYGDIVARVLQFKVYDSTRNDSELCLDCAIRFVSSYITEKRLADGR